LLRPPSSPLFPYPTLFRSSTWWGELITSDDGGKSWSKPRRLPAGMLGPIKNRPVLADGALVCGSSTESERDGWRVHMEFAIEGGDRKSTRLNSSHDQISYA